MKKNCNFAATYISKSGFVRLLVAGIFCACTLQIYGVSPVRCVNAPDCSSSVSQRVGNAVFCFHNEQILSVMTYTEKICPQVNNSTLPTTSSGTKSVPYNQFLIEKDAKNQAYLFILSNGLYHRFAEFCRNVEVEDYHAACVSVLLSTI